MIEIVVDMEQKSKIADQFPPACERAIEIINYLNECPDGRSFREVSENLNIPIASVYRICNCLVSYGVLRTSKASSDTLKLGYRIMEWAKNSTPFDITAYMHTLMRDLSSKTGQACQLCILSDNSAVIVAQEIPEKSVTLIASIGEKIPININAGARVLVSQYDEPRRSAFVKNAWKITSKETPYTEMNVDRYIDSLDGIREQGYALDIEEYALGIGCAAVPIFNSKGKAIAALGLTGFIDKYRETESRNNLISLLKKASPKFSEEIEG